ncbi:MAG: SUMF1/EgtB/PvdO family nonheme iron enzyme [Spirochaetaceae bacterium]|nr:SUMF1/EgtB/PvdO family nonheme iron enzyme [Spirochaetaceae bacterium]
MKTKNIFGLRPPAFVGIIANTTKQSRVLMLALLAIFALTLTTCQFLGDDIDTIRERARGEISNDDNNNNDETPVTFTVTYNRNNATGGTVPVDSTQYGSGASVTVRGNTGYLIRDNYIFNWWNTQADGNGTTYIGGQTFIISSDTTLYARWLREEHGISLSIEGEAIPNNYLQFPAANFGYTEQPSQTITVTNTENQPTGPLEVTVSPEGSFIVDPASIPSIAVGYSANFSIRPATGLPGGQQAHTAEVTVSGTGGITAGFDVSFIVHSPVITINTQPAATTNVVAGSISDSLSVGATVTGGATLSYQWFRNTTNSNVGGTPVSGATSASFTIPTDLTAGTYFYYCVVSATGGAISVQSNVATVNVAAPVITINTQPAVTTSVMAGSISGSLNVAASVTGDVVLSYQWFRNTTNSNAGGTPITEVTTSTSFNIPTNLAAGTYFYFVEVSALGAVIVRSNVARVFVSNIISPTGIEMMWVAGGQFELGRELGTAGSGNVTPMSTVTLTGFYIGKFPVTQAQFETVMTGNNNDINPTPSRFTTARGHPPAVGETDARRPVEMVSWYDAIVFCNRLSMREGLTPAYEMPNRWPNPTSWSSNPADWGTVPAFINSPSAILARWNNVRIVPGSTGYRLPTEAQWEYAAKGGNTRPNNFTFAGSNTVTAVAWHRDNNSGSRTREVGGLAPNGLGIHDMSGNVWELCWDWFGAYTAGAKTNPTGAASGTYRVRRGGSWWNTATWSRSVVRAGEGIPPNDRDDRDGFRVVRP